MFRCSWCENYKDKSECRENPTDPDEDNVCEECEEQFFIDREEESFKESLKKQAIYGDGKGL